MKITKQEWEKKKASNPSNDYLFNAIEYAEDNQIRTEAWGTLNLRWLAKYSEDNQIRTGAKELLDEN